MALKRQSSNSIPSGRLLTTNEKMICAFIRDIVTACPGVRKATVVPYEYDNRTSTSRYLITYENRKGIEGAKVVELPCSDKEFADRITTVQRLGGADKINRTEELGAPFRVDLPAPQQPLQTKFDPVSV